MWDKLSEDTKSEWRKDLRNLLTAALSPEFIAQIVAAHSEPVDMILHCPKCSMQHVDAPEPMTLKEFEDGKPWTNPPHRSHLCRPEDGGCGHIWRPADVPTNGVAAVQTKGQNDSPIEERVRENHIGEADEMVRGEHAEADRRDAERYRQLMRSEENAAAAAAFKSLKEARKAEALPAEDLDRFEHLLTSLVAEVALHRAAMRSADKPQEGGE